MPVSGMEFDAGVIIHEGRFVFKDYGCVQIIDLGEWREDQHSSPIPSWLYCLRRDAETWCIIKKQLIP